MSNEYSSSKHMIRFYIPGLFPSGRVLSSLIQLIESALVWGALGRMFYDRELRRKRYDQSIYGNTAISEKERMQNRRMLEDLELSLHPIIKSCESFLKNRYEPIIYKAFSVWRPDEDLPYKVRRQERMRDGHSEKEATSFHFYNYYEPRAVLYRIIEPRQFYGEEFSFMDFSAWILSELGSKTLITKSINTEKSLEFLFDVAIITSFFSMQHCPAIKDVFTYSLGVLKHWIGNNRKPEGILTPPRLDPSIVRLMEKYDDVELTITKNTYKFHLIRDPNSKVLD